MDQRGNQTHLLLAKVRMRVVIRKREKAVDTSKNHQGCLGPEDTWRAMGVPREQTSHTPNPARVGPVMGGPGRPSS